MHWLLFPGLLSMLCSWYLLNPDNSRARFFLWVRIRRLTWRTKGLVRRVKRLKDEAEEAAMAALKLNGRAAEIRWASGSCGNPGCTDPECCCALCARPIGLSEADLRGRQHDEECSGCELCEDNLPIILFRGKGKDSKQAAFHTACFEKLIAA